MSVRSLAIDRWTKWHTLGAAVMALLGVLATFPAWQDIYAIATDTRNDENSQILLVPLVALFLVWVRRRRFRHCKASGTIIGPILVAVGWTLSTIGFYHRISSFWHGGAVLVVLGCVLSVLGKDVLLRFFPAVALLVFLVPVPGELRTAIALPLQSGLAHVSQFLLEILGVETIRSGSQLTINNVPLEIAEACNGMRMVYALILVVYAFAFGLPLRNSVRFLLLLLSPMAAMACNVLRILALAFAFGYGSTQFALTFHDMAGWLMLPLAFGLLYGIIQVLKWAMIPVTKYTLSAQ